MNPAERVRSALAYIPPIDRDKWLRVGMAVKCELGEDGFPIWDEWSQGDESYSSPDARVVWRSIKPTGRVTGATLFYEARQRGWSDRRKGDGYIPSPAEVAERDRRQRVAEEDTARRRVDAKAHAKAIWETSPPAPTSHPYLARKSVDAHRLRQYAGSLCIGGMDCDGALIVPVRDAADELQSLEFISAAGDKRYLPGGKIAGCYYTLGTPGDDPLYLAEGFATGASVAEATGLAVAVAFNAGNLEPVAKALRGTFPKTPLVVAADNDHGQAINVGLEAARKAAAAVGAAVARPFKDQSGDFNDLVTQQGLEAAREILFGAIDVAVERLQTKAPALQRRPLPDPLPPVPAFEMNLLPNSVRAWVADCADGLQVPPDYVAIGVMVALAGTIGRQVGIAVKQKDRWIERPMLWGAIVGRPSSGKSPALRPAQGMLARLEDFGLEQYEHEKREFAAKLIVNAAAATNGKKTAAAKLKAGDSQAALDAATASLMEDEEPQQARLVINEATVQKTGEILNANPRGLVMFRDELSGWLASMDKEGREGDRAFWLECWGGQGPYTSDTIGRGSVRVEACAVSMLGGIQPGKLAEYVRGAVRGGSGDDGLMQRFGLAVYPDLPKDWRYTDRTPDEAAQHFAWLTFQRLDALNPDALGCTRDEYVDVPFLRFSDEAQGMFSEWQTRLMGRLRAGQEPPFLESHFAKYPALVARLALVIHLADDGRGDVSGGAMAKALGWVEYLEGHARRIYAPATDGGLTAAHALLAKRQELAVPFSVRDVYRKGWAGLSSQEAAEAAMGWLEEYGHAVPAPPAESSTGGRPTLRYQWSKP